MRFPIPFKDLLPIEAIKQLSQLVSQPTLVNAMKEAAQKIGLKDQFQSGNIQQILQQAGRWMESAAEPWLRNAQPGLLPGINATGEFFSNRWCSHRMCSDAITQMNHLQSHFAETVKLDQQLRSLLIGLTSAQVVAVVPSTTLALYVLAMAEISSKDRARWVLPRVDCIRLPQAGATQGGNVRTILDQANAMTNEIGTNQDCMPSDFAEALREPSARLLIASPNSLTSESRLEHRNRGLTAAKQAGAGIAEILLDGTIHDLSGLGITSRVIADAWDDGVELIIVPGDALLGGPECGIILGQQTAMENVLKIVDALGMHASSITKAALLRTLQASELIEQWRQLPIGASLSTSFENLQNRAERLVAQLAVNPMFERVVVARKSCRIGAGVWSSQRLDSSTIQLFPKSISPSAMAELFAAKEVPVWTNVQSDHVELVLRSMEPDEDRILIQQLCPVAEA
jgi:L-seryl-tRNA(Ser) seleniumtransferase